MAKENVNLDFRLRKIDETINYILDEIKHNDLMSENDKKVSSALNFCEHFLVFVFPVSGCILISAFASLFGVPVGIARSAVVLNICA